MSASKPLPVERVLLLKDGDRLSRDEFERRYSATPNLKKAELIEGVVYIMPSPVRVTMHGRPHAHVINWLGHYEAYTLGLTVADNGTVRLDENNEPQPDAMLFLDSRCGGQATIDADGYVEGAPELVVEVSGSTTSIDLHTKKSVYRRNGVREYLVWRVQDQQLDWFVAKGNEFVPHTPEDSGILHSAVFPGLWLDSAALIRGDLAAVFTVLQAGLASPEHAEFVKKIVGSRQ